MSNQSKDLKLGILVFGYDGYRDVWEVFFSLLKKNWHDNPYNVYFSSSDTNNLNYDFTFIKTLNKETWTKRLYDSLLSIHEDYVLLLLEDFFITDKVITGVIAEVLNTILGLKNKYYKFKVRPFSIKYGKKTKLDENTYYIDSNRKYGISIQPAIWEKKYLMSLLLGINKSAWEFEHFLDESNLINDSELEKHIYDSRNIFNIENALIKSKYTRKAYKIVKKQLGVKKINRQRLDFFETLLIRIKIILRYIIPGSTHKKR